MRTVNSERQSGAFTVIELLAVVAVTGLLGILFLPLFNSVRADAQNAQCGENLRQIGKSAGIYVADHAGKLPGCQHEPPSWVKGLEAYCSVEKFVCPPHREELANPPTKRSERIEWTYALNDFLTPHPYGARSLDFSRMASVPSPWETMLFGEAGIEYRRYDHFHFADRVENGFTAAAFSEQVDVERHEGGANYLFADGRVEELGWSSGAKPKLSFPNSRFVHPSGESGPQQIAKR